MTGYDVFLMVVRLKIYLILWMCLYFSNGVSFFFFFPFITTRSKARDTKVLIEDTDDEANT